MGSESLEQIEARHGFVFGVPRDHTSNDARVKMTIKCQTTGCDRNSPRDPGIPIHEDTVLPVLCGGCGAVLHCEHVRGDEVDEVRGTYVDPRIATVTRCRACGYVMDEREVTAVGTALEDLPAVVAQQLGVNFQRSD